MARHDQKDLNLAVGLAQLAALAVLCWLLLPPDRDLLKADVLIPVVSVVLVLMVSLIVLLISDHPKPRRSPGTAALAAPRDLGEKHSG